MRKPRNYTGRYSGQQKNKKNGIMIITAIVLLLLIFVLSFMLAYHFLAPGSSIDPNAPEETPIVSETPAPTPDTRDARIEELEAENKALVEENEALRAEVEKYQSILGNSMTATQAPAATQKPAPTPTPTPAEGGTEQ